MATESEIRKNLENISRRFAPDMSNIAKVSSVNEKECTCVLIDDDGQEFFDVRLRPVTGENKSFLQIPKEGSFVLAVRVENSDDWMIVACSEIERIQVIVGNENLKDIINDLFSAFANMTFSNSGGVTGVPINILEFEALRSRINNIIF